MHCVTWYPWSGGNGGGRGAWGRHCRRERKKNGPQWVYFSVNVSTDEKGQGKFCSAGGRCSLETWSISGAHHPAVLQELCPLVTEEAGGEGRQH